MVRCYKTCAIRVEPERKYSNTIGVLRNRRCGLMHTLFQVVEYRMRGRVLLFKQEQFMRFTVTH